MGRDKKEFLQPTNKADYDYVNRPDPLEPWEQECSRLIWLRHRLDNMGDTKTTLYERSYKELEQKLSEYWKDPRVRDMYRVCLKAGNHYDATDDPDKLPGLDQFSAITEGYFNKRNDAYLAKLLPGVEAPKKKNIFQKAAEYFFGSPEKKNAEKKNTVEKHTAEKNAQTENVQAKNAQAKAAQAKAAPANNAPAKAAPAKAGAEKSADAAPGVSPLKNANPKNGSLIMEALKGIVKRYVPKEKQGEINENNVFDYLKLGNTTLNQGKYKDMAPLDKANLFIEKVREYQGIDVTTDAAGKTKVPIDSLENKVKEFRSFQEALHKFENIYNEQKTNELKSSELHTSELKSKGMKAGELKSGSVEKINFKELSGKDLSVSSAAKDIHKKNMDMVKKAAHEDKKNTEKKNIEKKNKEKKSKEKKTPEKGKSCMSL